MSKPLSAYEGDDPYVFVCYAHEDAASVYPEIERLQQDGINVWWDEGISAGLEWSEELARRLEGCAAFVFYLSPRSVASQHCRNEVSLALEQSCAILVVHLEETDLSPGLRLSLNSRQAILRYQLPEEVYAQMLESGIRTSLDAVADPPRAPSEIVEKVLEVRAEIQGERKHLTVLVASLHDAGALWALDPEASHGLLKRFQAVLADGVHQYEGTVNQYSGAGATACFGAPIAHEDHAQRACYAALLIHDRFRDWADDLRRTMGLSLALRIGIDSGEVVVGQISDDLRMKFEAHGLALGLAAAVSRIAEPGHTYLTEGVQHLVAGYFDLRQLGEFVLEDVGINTNLFDLEAVSGRQTRLDVQRSQGFSRFVGRAEEMHALEAALERAKAGNGQVVAVVASAGTGKSRLCAEFVGRCREQGTVVHEAHCPAHGRTVPLLPVLELYRNYFGIEARDGPSMAREKIAGRLLLLDDAFADTLPLLFDFLGVADPDRPAPELEPEARQLQLYGLLRRIVQYQSARGPLMIYLDDLHWIDEASDRYVAQLVDAVSGTRTLLLLNFRPMEYHPDWTGRSHYQQLPLMPLSLEATEELLAALIGADPGNEGLAARIHRLTEGNPFFTEEVVQALAESGQLQRTGGSYRLVAPLDSLDLPPTVVATLQSRVDRLEPSAKRLLQQAAVIGRSFEESLLSVVSERTLSELRSTLSELVEGEFLVQRAGYPAIEFSFKHPLTHQVVEESQLKEPRMATHRSVAQAIESVHSDALDEWSPLIAQHWERAHEYDAAARWHVRSAQWIGLTDLEESSRHWRSVISLSEEASEPDEFRIGDACYQLLNLGWRTRMSGEERDRLLARSRQSFDKSSDVPNLVRSLVASTSHRYLNDSELEPCLPILEEALALSIPLQNPDVEIDPRNNLSDVRWLSGDLPGAIKECDRICELAHRDPTVVTHGGHSAYMAALGRRSVVRHHMGLHHLAREDIRQAREFAGQTERDEDICVSLYFQAEGDLYEGALEDRAELSRRVEEIASRIGNAAFFRLGLLAAACFDVAHGDPDRVISLVDRSRITDVGAALFDGLGYSVIADAWRRSGGLEKAVQAAEMAVNSASKAGARAYESWARLSLAKHLIAVGQTDELVINDLLDRVRELIEETGARGHLPFVFERRAELSRLQGDDATAERHLDHARQLFREMGATGHLHRLGDVALAAGGKSP